jgi:F-type H+-transporting ATPase subunit a
VSEVQKDTRPLWRKNRFWVLLLLVASVYFSFFSPAFMRPVLPHIALPAEVIFPLAIGGFQIGFTNTQLAMLIADAILLLLAFAVSRAASSGQLVPSGIAGALEALLEVIHNLTETTAGKWTKQIFPFFAAITLLVLVVNWTELLPGVDSIGRIEKEVPKAAATGAAQAKPAEEKGHTVVELAPGVATISKDKGEYLLVPYLRVLSTDLNFTLALALIAMFMVQVMGYRAQGGAYFLKFFNVGAIFAKPGMGIIDFAVSILELISEFAKIISFTFRLFGNIFAGSVLLFVMGYLVPAIQTAFLMIEFAVGLIQAVVFGMLTMVFMSQATQGHGGGHEEHH